MALNIKDYKNIKPTELTFDSESGKYVRLEFMDEDNKKVLLTDVNEIDEFLNGYYNETNQFVDTVANLVFINEKEKTEDNNKEEKKEDKKEEKKEENKADNTKEEKKEEKKEDKKEDKKVKIKRLPIKILSIGACIVTVFVGGYHVCKNGLFNKDKNKDNDKNNIPGIVEIDNNGFDDISIFYQDKNDDSLNDREYYQMTQNAIYNQDKVKSVLQGVRYGNCYSQDELDMVFNYLSNLAVSNTFEISQFINGKELNGAVNYVQFQNLFDADSEEYMILDQFCQLKNTIIRCAYVDHDVKATKQAVKNFMDFYVRFVYEGNVLPYNKNGVYKNVSFDQLDKTGQLCLSELGMYMFSIQYKNYSVDGYKLNDIRERAEEMCMGVISNIADESSIKR